MQSKANPGGVPFVSQLPLTFYLTRKSRARGTEAASLPCSLQTFKSSLDLFQVVAFDSGRNEIFRALTKPQLELIPLMLWRNERDRSRIVLVGVIVQIRVIVWNGRGFDQVERIRLRA